ncbi:SEL1-like repeat protein [uncultured Shimia sp.]|uniref:SEL1-like repeat protein n=1 Tax=uncultured Shimia sp. TaxID=573152 RepID=UPI0026042E19|nr:SEL1-like repeat protein [uncultured Shimia sp.]
MRWHGALITLLLFCGTAAVGTLAIAQTGEGVAPEVSDTGQEYTPQEMYDLGMQFHSGEGVLQNFASAGEWFGRAAQQGHVAAQNRWGQYLFTGYGGTADPATGLLWLKAAAQAGDPDHVFDYASALETAPEALGDMSQAAQMYARAAEKGHLEAMVSLGVLFQNGTGVPKDLARAKQFYELAVSENHPRAQNNLGLLYVRGEGVTQDYVRAAELFAAASEQGLKVAKTNLGVMYENGFGVPLDEARAAELYREGAGQTGSTASSGSADPFYDPRLSQPDTSEAGLKLLQESSNLGDPISQFQLGWLLLIQSDRTPAAQIQAATHMRSAAEAGLAPAMINLAGLYARGEGVPQDYVLAQMWMIRAVRFGHTGDPGLAEFLASHMTVEQVSEAQKRAQ